MGYNPGWGYGQSRGYNPPHYGIDFRGVKGTPIPAADAGTVVYSGMIGSGSGPTGKGYGYTVIIKHPDGTYTLYGHMNGENMPNVGDPVGKGFPVGEVGNTGHSTGTNGGYHEHYETRGEDSLVWDGPEIGKGNCLGPKKGKPYPTDPNNWNGVGPDGPYDGRKDGSPLGDIIGGSMFGWPPDIGGIIGESMFGGLRDGFNDAARTTSPIVFDLDGDGIETTSLSYGIFFDHDANGFAELTGWVSSDDGMLVLDRNNDGIINDGKELFGDQTILNNGSKAANGFQALADLDDNQDGKIDYNDVAYSQLKVWQDLDGDGYNFGYRQKIISNNKVERVMLRSGFFS